MMFEQKLHRAGWLAGEHAGFDPASTTARCTLFGSTVHLVPRKAEVTLCAGFMGVTMSPFRKRVNEHSLMFILVHTLAEGVG